ncbi:hypothetical protein Tco_0108883 [Tanacetum coccineum]
MRKQRKETEVSQDDTQHGENIPTPSNDPQPSGKDRIKVTKLMILCTNLQKQVLDLEKAKDAQAKEIFDLKKRVQKLEKRKKSRPTGLTRLRKVDAEVVMDVVAGEKEEQGTKVDEMEVSTTEVVTTASKAVTTVVKDSASPIITVTTAATTLTTAASTPAISKDELSLAETLIEIKAAKFKAITSVATTVNTRPKAKAIVFHEQEEQAATFRPVVSSAQSSKSKDKGKAIMIEPEKPLKKKDQVALDEEMARNLEAQMQAELIEEERLKRQREEEANIALIESWDNTQVMMEADFELAQRLQTKEHGEITIKERSILFVELMNNRKKHFAKLRAKEIRRKPLTKAQKRNQMSTYLKNIGGFKHKVVKRSEAGTEKSSKREGDKLGSDMSKKQKIDEHVETEEHTDKEEEELKKHLEIVKDDEVAIEAIPLATKPPMIIEYKIVREGMMGHFQLKRDNGSIKRHSSMIRML